MPVLITLWVIVSVPAIAAPDADLWPDWQAHDDSNDAIIDHSVWQTILDHHLVVVSSGVTAFDYAGAKSSSLTHLSDYLNAMQAVKIDAYNRDQQMAFWINLYNAQTVAVVMDHYPVDSIRDIDISPGLFRLDYFRQALGTKTFDRRRQVFEPERYRTSYPAAHLAGCAYSLCP